MAMETGTTKDANLAKVQDIDFSQRFGYSVKKLIEALGITRKLPKSAGTVLKAYKVTGTLKSGKVGEGEAIPLSEYSTTYTAIGEVTLEKWAKSTTAEAISNKGYKQAVIDTDNKMLQDIQKEIRKKFFDFLATGTGTATGTGLQAALAQCWGQLQILFEDDTIESVYMLNPLDVADYLATAEISTQSAFGMTYIENFLGLGTVFLNSSVPKGKIYATAKENIVLYYIPVNGADLGEAFTFTSDETGYIGVHHESDYTNLTNDTTAVSGVGLFAENLAGVVVGAISAPAASGTDDSGT